MIRKVRVYPEGRNVVIEVEETFDSKTFEIKALEVKSVEFEFISDIIITYNDYRRKRIELFGMRRDDVMEVVRRIKRCVSEIKDRYDGVTVRNSRYERDVVAEAIGTGIGILVS